MRFSIIIPAYNAEKTVSETIESVLEQDYKDYEIIVINDNSQDKTSETVSKYKQVKLIKNIEQLKAGGSRNVGIDNASGEYIIFLDADDKLLDETVLTRIDQNIGQDSYDLLYLGFVENVDGKISTKHIPSIEQEDVEMRISEWKYPNVWDVCWNKNFLDKHGIRFIEKRYIAEDALFYYQGLINATKTKVTDVVSHVYRIDSKSDSVTTKVTLEKMNDFYYMISKTYELIERAPDKYKKYLLIAVRNEIDYANRLSKKLEEQLKKDY